MIPDHHVAVLEAVKTYLDGLYYSDADRLRSVMHPQARYINATDAPIVDLPRDEYLAIVERRASPASRHEARRDEIVSIHFAGPVSAVVRVNCSLGGRDFRDLLTFIKDEARWRIIAKVFEYTDRN